MPYFDGTGPMGTGPYGRGLGPCGGGRRFGAGFGMGRGRRMGFAPVYQYVEPTDVEVKRSLEVEVEALEARLKYLKDQLRGAEKDSS